MSDSWHDSTSNLVQWPEEAEASVFWLYQNTKLNVLACCPLLSLSTSVTILLQPFIITIFNSRPFLPGLRKLTRWSSSGRARSSEGIPNCGRNLCRCALTCIWLQQTRAVPRQDRTASLTWRYVSSWRGLAAFHLSHSNSGKHCQCQHCFPHFQVTEMMHHAVMLNLITIWNYITHVLTLNLSHKYLTLAGYIPIRLLCRSNMAILCHPNYIHNIHHTYHHI